MLALAAYRIRQLNAGLPALPVQQLDLHPGPE
jgi:hypothetical protein